MAEQFDPNEFLHTEVNEGMDTEIIQPEPGEYPAKIDGVEVVSGHNEEKDIDWYRATITWDLSENQEVLDHCQRDKVTVRQNLFLDVEEGPGGKPQLSTATGKNVQLGRLREAVGLNEGSFNLSMLEGQRAKVRISQRFSPDGNEYREVRQVAPLE